MSQRSLFSALPAALQDSLERMNPWWRGEPQAPLPETRRHLVAQLKRRLELALAPITVLRGPRQIGKTTAQKQIIQDLLDAATDPRRILRVQFDELPSFRRLEEPILGVVRWFESNALGRSLNEAANAGEPAYLFFDEVQNRRDWAPQLKSLVDHSAASVLVTGSSTLRIEAGRDSLAGRVHTLEAGVLSLTEIGHFRGFDRVEPFLPDSGVGPLGEKSFWLELRGYGRKHREQRDRAFRHFSERGGYPLAHRADEIPWDLLAEQLNETVIRRVIQHDLRIGERGRKRDPELLEEIFRLACRYAGQTPGTTTLGREVHRALDANVGSRRVGHYLRFLDDSLLIRLIRPLEIRLKKTRGQKKICLADHGLRRSWLQERIPITPEDLARQPEMTVLAGHLVESIVGATLASFPGLALAHLPARGGEPEVDFVISEGAIRIPLEVKYRRRIDPLRDTEGLRTFLERVSNQAPFGLLVTQDDEEQVDDPRIVTMPLSTLLLLR